MAEYVFAPPPIVAAPVHGGGLFPVRRIFCVGKNYVDHVREMGDDPKDTPPVFFTKPADAFTGDRTVPYPSETEDFHYEGELVIALKAGGRNIDAREEAGALIFGQAAGCDFTRRDQQAAAKKKGGPWDTAKGFDYSAALAPIARIEDFPPERFDDAHIVTKVNGETRQDGALSNMIWTVPEIIMALSRQFELKAGDLIYTGTPEGVGAINVGDEVTIEVGPLPALNFSVSEPL